MEASVVSKVTAQSEHQIVQQNEYNLTNIETDGLTVESIYADKKKTPQSIECFYEHVFKWILRI